MRTDDSNNISFLIKFVLVKLVCIYICELGWKYSKGFVSDEMIKHHLPPPSSDTVILMCGPPPMINFACQPNLDKLGYSQKSRFAY